MGKNRRVIVSLALALVALLVVFPVAIAQEEPPTLRPPQIFKTADDTRLKLGDPVQFTIVVTNPSDSGSEGTWKHVRVTDNIHPALRIDVAQSTKGTVTVTGQTVVINGGITLAPGEHFVITIGCTLLGPVEEGQVLINTASLEYTDSNDVPQPIIDVDEPVRIIIEEEIPPVVPEASSLLLLGSAASVLAGYAGLQIRARRRHRS